MAALELGCTPVDSLEIMQNIPNTLVFTNAFSGFISTVVPSPLELF